MNIIKCMNCGKKRLFILDNNSFLCMDCREYHEIVHKEVDGLSWWLWSKEYKAKR